MSGRVRCQARRVVRWFSSVSGGQPVRIQRGLRVRQSDGHWGGEVLEPMRVTAGLVFTALVSLPGAEAQASSSCRNELVADGLDRGRVVAVTGAPVGGIPLIGGVPAATCRCAVGARRQGSARDELRVALRVVLRVVRSESVLVYQSYPQGKRSRRKPTSRPLPCWVLSRRSTPCGDGEGRFAEECSVGGTGCVKGFNKVTVNGAGVSVLTKEREGRPLLGSVLFADVGGFFPGGEGRSGAADCRWHG